MNIVGSCWGLIDSDGCSVFLSRLAMFQYINMGPIGLFSEDGLIWFFFQQGCA